MKFNSKSFNPAVALALVALAALPACFTGIEKTPTIKADSSSKNKNTQTPEQLLMERIAIQRPAQWMPGKAFVVTDGRLEYAYSPSNIVATLSEGDTIRFQELVSQVRLSGDSVTDMLFTTPAGSIISTRVESPLPVVRTLSSIPVPFAIDTDLVNDVRALLEGKTVWTRRMGNNGRKFARVTIDRILPGNADYPLRVVAGGDSLFMVVGSKSASARTFDNLFSLSDPRKLYPNISDSNWDLICRGKVALDMTRDECRLSLGTPAQVDRMAAYNGLIESWTYENGVHLVFTDGLLTRFRQ